MDPKYVWRREINKKKRASQSSGALWDLGGSGSGGMMCGAWGKTGSLPWYPVLPSSSFLFCFAGDRWTPSVCGETRGQQRRKEASQPSNQPALKPASPHLALSCLIADMILVLHLVCALLGVRWWSLRTALMKPHGCSQLCHRNPTPHSLGALGRSGIWDALGLGA